MNIQFLLTMAFSTLLLNSFLPLEGRPFSRIRKQCSYNEVAFAEAPVQNTPSFNPYEASYQKEQYPYEYDNTPTIYANKPRDVGLYYYDYAGSRAGTMNRYNGYYNTSFLAGTYTSGVSSYPGTTTGPGISNGYAGTPFGIYFTDSRYYDRNIRVHSDVYNRSRLNH